MRFCAVLKAAGLNLLRAASARRARRKAGQAESSLAGSFLKLFAVVKERVYKIVTSSKPVLANSIQLADDYLKIAAEVPPKQWTPRKAQVIWAAGVCFDVKEKKKELFPRIQGRSRAADREKRIQHSRGLPKPGGRIQCPTSMETAAHSRSSRRISRQKGRLKPPDEEMRRLKRELDRAKEERDILKKALAYFAEDQK